MMLSTSVPVCKYLSLKKPTLESSPHPHPGTDLHPLALTHRYPHPLANSHPGTNSNYSAPGWFVRPHLEPGNRPTYRQSAGAGRQ
jgi:hypothetical protein